MTACPHCGQPMPETRLGVVLTPRKAKIFDLVKRRGEAGISTDELRTAVLGERGTAHCLASHIWQINAAIEDSGYRIKGYSGFYRLVRKRVK